MKNATKYLCIFLAGMMIALAANVVSAAYIAGGTYHSLAVASDWTVAAWGHNGVGQLGNGGVGTDEGWGPYSSVPVQAIGLYGATAVAGGYGHSLALKSDGTVWAWGWNVVGQLGDGTTTDRYTPVQVSELSGVTDVASGNDYSLALKSDGTA